MQKFIRIFLLVLIIIGIVALATQKTWVPKLVEKILSSRTYFPNTPILNTNTETPKSDFVRVETPLPGQTITSPLVIKGTARGSWFFEASFPVTLVNWDGLIIAQGVAQAKSDWMTTDFVPFEATLTFNINKKAYSNRGALILRKDNPSGLAKNSDSLEIPIVFAD